MIGHAVETKQFLTFVPDNAGDVFVYLVFEGGSDEIIAPSDGENDVNSDLGITICHTLSSQYAVPFGL